MMQKKGNESKKVCALCKIGFDRQCLTSFMRKLSLDQALAESVNSKFEESKSFEFSSLKNELEVCSNSAWVKNFLYKSKSEPIMSSAFASTYFNNNQPCACSNFMTSPLKSEFMSSDMSSLEITKRCIIKLDGYSYIIGKLFLIFFTFLIFIKNTFN